jgi:hypothetical protein
MTGAGQDNPEVAGILNKWANPSQPNLSILNANRGEDSNMPSSPIDQAPGALGGAAGAVEKNFCPHCGKPMGGAPGMAGGLDGAGGDLLNTLGKKKVISGTQ